MFRDGNRLDLNGHIYDPFYEGWYKSKFLGSPCLKLLVVPAPAQLIYLIYNICITSHQQLSIPQ